MKVTTMGLVSISLVVLAQFCQAQGALATKIGQPSCEQVLDPKMSAWVAAEASRSIHSSVMKLSESTHLLAYLTPFLQNSIRVDEYVNGFLSKRQIFYDQPTRSIFDTVDTIRELKLFREIKTGKIHLAVYTSANSVRIFDVETRATVLNEKSSTYLPFELEYVIERFQQLELGSPEKPSH